MSAGNGATIMPAAAMESPGVAGSASAEEAAVRAAHKRYEGLVMVRNKAIKGKGAWYWAHFEPLLVSNSPDDAGGGGIHKSVTVKLKCCLCDTVFSASNPSRTATEHLKRGSCPNFTSSPTPISSVSPNSSSIIAHASPFDSSTSSLHNHRKRSSSGGSNGGGRVASSAAGTMNTVASPPYNASPLAIIDPSRYCPEMGYSHVAVSAPSAGATTGMMMVGQHNLRNHQPPPQQQHLVLSGGKEDLGALAMLEDSVKRLRSPKTSPSPSLSKAQMVQALDYLADWVYESCGSVSFSSLDHPKFKLFLGQVGLPGISRREICGSRLDSKYEEAKSEAEVRIRDAMFFQIASDGWKPSSRSGCCGFVGGDCLVNLSVNLPNGTSVYRRALFTGGQVPSNYAEDVLRETIADTCGNSVQQCVGIVADRFKSKALRNLENQNSWMVNLHCQYQGISSLIKDFYRELPLFKSVAENCLKLGNFVNNNSHIRHSFCKYRIREDGHAGLLRLPVHGQPEELPCFEPVFLLIEDIMSSARALQSILLDECNKIAMMEGQNAREFEEMVQDMGFWSDLEAVHSLVKLVKETAHEIESERPLVGQCLPLWDELKSKVRNWCAKFHVSDGHVEKVIERRFQKNYHPAWAAAYILDPLYLVRDTSGKYLPPFKSLTHEQEKDVDRLTTRLVSREEAHVALMELMKWRTEGLDPVYAQAVQLKRRDRITGKMRIANPQSSRLVWETYLTEFKSLGKVAVRLIFLHATSRGFKSNPSFSRWVHSFGHSRIGADRAQKLIFVAAHSKLERRDFSNEDDKDAELLALANGEDDHGLNEVFLDASSLV